MKLIYTDASFDFVAEADNGKDHVIGKTAMVSGAIRIVDLAYIPRVAGLVQYINILETMAITRAIGVAGANLWSDDLLIRTDSRIAVSWFKHGPRAQCMTPVHENMMKVLRAKVREYPGKVTVEHVRREDNLAGWILERELEFRRPNEL